MKKYNDDFKVDILSFGAHPDDIETELIPQQKHIAKLEQELKEK